MRIMLTDTRNPLVPAGSEPAAIAAAIVVACILLLVPMWPINSASATVRSVRRQTRGPVIAS